jgi:hypothetical protein
MSETAKLTVCVQSWRGDDGQPHFCGEERGHSGECRCEVCALLYSETVETV